MNKNDLLAFVICLPCISSFVAYVAAPNRLAAYSFWISQQNYKNSKFDWDTPGAWVVSRFSDLDEVAAKCIGVCRIERPSNK